MTYDGLSQMGYGMYLVNAGGNALLANLVMQVSSNPPMLCVSLGKSNLTHDLVSENGRFTVSVLTEAADLAFLGRFGFQSGRETNKLEGIECREFGGVPTVAQHCNTLISCEVVTELETGDATVFLGRILECKAISPAKSMSWDYYQKVIKGQVPSSSPAYAARYEK